MSVPEQHNRKAQERVWEAEVKRRDTHCRKDLKASRSSQWMLGKEQTMAETSTEGSRIEEPTASPSRPSPPLPTELFSSDFIIAPYKTGYPPFESHATISAVLVGETQSAIIPFKRSGVGRNSLSFQQMCAGKRREGDITAYWASNKARFMFP